MGFQITPWEVNPEHLKKEVVKQKWMAVDHSSKAALYVQRCSKFEKNDL